MRSLFLMLFMTATFAGDAGGGDPWWDAQRLNARRLEGVAGGISAVMREPAEGAEEDVRLIANSLSRINAEGWHANRYALLAWRMVDPRDAALVLVEYKRTLDDIAVFCPERAASIRGLQKDLRTPYVIDYANRVCAALAAMEKTCRDISATLPKDKP